jgi:alpha-D-xyloside xylohydrolase
VLEPSSSGWDPAASRSAPAVNQDPTHRSGANANAKLIAPLPGVVRLLSGSAPATEALQPNLRDDSAAIGRRGDVLLLRSGDLHGEWDVVHGALSAGPARLSVGHGTSVPGPPAANPAGASIGTPARIDRDADVGGWRISCHLGPDDAVYGGGGSGQALNLRGRRRDGRNVNLHGAAGTPSAYLNVPFYWSDAGWGVFVNTGGRVQADLGNSDADTVRLDVEDDSLDLFLIVGPAPLLLRRYLQLTGAPARLPPWAFGVWTSRCSYFSLGEVEEVLDRYEESQCPVDVVHVDAWQVGNVWRDLSCNWEIDRARWPLGWTQRLHERGVRVSIWLSPYVRQGTSAGDEAVEAGAVFRGRDGSLVSTTDRADRLVINVVEEPGLTWWQQRLRALIGSEDVDALKTDFGEEIPPGAVLSDERTGNDICNEYSLRYEAATHRVLAGMRGHNSAMLSRSGTAGAQRYPGHWAGDTPSSWSGLRTALRTCLSLSLSGFAYVTSDIGGFWTPDGLDRASQAFSELNSAAFTADVDPELFARWAQWGALSGLMRFHGIGVREPWAYPEPYKSVAIGACRLRRTLGSYLQRAMDEAHEGGLPLMRPMVLAYPGDRAARDAELQYLLGPNLLVAPVLQPGGRLRLWVPPGTWEPVAGAATVSGPGWRELLLDLAAIPAWRLDRCKQPVR